MLDFLLLAQDAGDAVAWGFGGMMILMVLLGVLAVVVWIWALIDAIRNPHLDDTMRIVWVLVIVFTQIVGAIIYLIIGRSSQTRTHGGF